MFRTTKKVLGLATGVLAIAVTILWDASRKLSEDDSANEHYDAEHEAARRRRREMTAR